MPTLKQTASALHGAYEAQLKGYKSLTITHKTADDGQVSITLSGPAGSIDTAHKALTADATLAGVTPDRATIHQARYELGDGPKAEKEGDQTKSLTIHHVITTY